MQKSARQSMAWLHSWLGLLLGWLLFCIFLAGSISYYRQEINLWSQPELANIQVDQEKTIQYTIQYLQKNAKDAQSWFIQAATDENPVNKIYWQKADGTYESKTLNPNTGKELTLTQIPAGDFFYNFHFQLFGIPYYIGRLIVSFAAFIMLISFISGVITHKKIFTDFFTLRTFKGPRSYLDFHNVISAIALPFFLTITFTGLAIFFYLYFPQGIQKLYPQNNFQYFEEINTISKAKISNASPAKMLDIHQIQNIVSQNFLGNIIINTIELKNPNTQSATMTFTALQDSSITRNVPRITLNAITGDILGTTKNTSAVATLNAGVYGLHMAKFAQPFLRLGLFFSGILGCLMIASGLLLWSLKRQLQNSAKTLHLGHFLVDRLNIATIIGLPIAIICYLLSNRIAYIFNVPNIEIKLFFIAWAFCLLFTFVIQKSALWAIFLKLLIGLSCFLILLNWCYLVYFLQFKQPESYWKFIRVDLFILFFICFAIFIQQHIEPIKEKALIRMKNKQKVKQHETLQ